MQAHQTLMIRPYRTDDSAACRECVVELQDAERLIDPRLRGGESIVDAYLAQMHERCREYAGCILIAEREGVVVGLVMVLARVPYESLDDPPGAYAVIAELVVRAEVRGGGVGRELMNAAEQYARDAGATELRINVMRNNHPARALYLAQDFVPYLEVLSKLRPSRPAPHSQPT